jgi:hypothetical protein
MYTEDELAVFTPEFQRFLRQAAQALRHGRPSRSTQLNVALSYWLQEQRRR